MKKRILSLLCTFTMVAGLGFGISADKEVLAAGEVPTVEMVGATILKGSTETQSLRFLMKVKNYKSIASKDFGMKLNVAGKTAKTVSYKDAKEIYAIDEANGVLEYAVEVAGINFDNIEKNITAQAFIEDQAPVAGGTIERNVKQVATAAGYNLAQKDGKIVATPDVENGYKVDLTSDTTVIGDSGTVEQDKAKETITLIGSASGISIKLTDPLPAGKYIVKLEGSSASKVRFGFATKPDGEGKSSVMADGTPAFSDFNFGASNIAELKGNADYLTIKGPAGEMIDGMVLTSVSIEKYVEKAIDYTQPVKVDLDSLQVQHGNIVYEDGKIKFKDTAWSGGTNEAYLPLKSQLLDMKTIGAGKTVTVNIKGTYTGDTGFRVWLGNGSNSFTQKVDSTEINCIGFAKQFANGAFDKTFTVKVHTDSDKLTFKGGGKVGGVDNAPWIANLEISEISITYPQES